MSLKKAFILRGPHALFLLENVDDVRYVALKSKYLTAQEWAKVEKAFTLPSLLQNVFMIFLFEFR